MISKLISNKSRVSKVSRNSILDTTYDFLSKYGYQKLTMQNIATSAGVSKNTIYRWWSGKGQLAVESFLYKVSPLIAFPDSELSSESIRLQLEKIAFSFDDSTRDIFRQLIGVAQTNNEMLSFLVDGYILPRRLAAIKVIKKGILNGEFIDGIDPDFVIDSLYSPLYYHLLTGQDISHSFLDKIFSLVMEDILVKS